MKEFLSEFSDTILKLKNNEEIEKFFTEILTENEIKDLKLRWELMKMLKKGYSQRKIAKELKISLCKITRGAKIVKNPDSVINRIL